MIPTAFDAGEKMTDVAKRVYDVTLPSHLNQLGVSLHWKVNVMLHRGFKRRKKQRVYKVYNKNINLNRVEKNCKNNFASYESNFAILFANLG